MNFVWNRQEQRSGPISLSECYRGLLMYTLYVCWGIHVCWTFVNNTPEKVPAS